ncbi:hypothetical protein HPP92_021215 [Vanilla planifolia]|uniref:Protein kinase domain-containing protein n=1 Tax=Vanilla planifolia TaxID=51239 RepID=A0A835PXQ4_VANPL|nr:hypothetical protein HPP92_021215 [Vanilla planifolia]
MAQFLTVSITLPIGTTAMVYRIRRTSWTGITETVQPFSTKAVVSILFRKGSVEILCAAIFIFQLHSTAHLHNNLYPRTLFHFSNVLETHVLQIIRAHIHMRASCSLEHLFFQDVTTETIFKLLMKSIWEKYGSISGSISLQNVFFDNDSYLEVQLLLCSLSTAYFDTKDILANLDMSSYGYNVIGSGGFGKVYRGMVPDGKMVAIKRSKVGSSQGGLEFKNRD